MCVVTDCLQESCARILLYRGARKDTKNNSGQTPFQVTRCRLGLVTNGGPARLRLTLGCTASVGCVLVLLAASSEGCRKTWICSCGPGNPRNSLFGTNVKELHFHDFFFGPIAIFSNENNNVPISRYRCIMSNIPIFFNYYR